MEKKDKQSHGEPKDFGSFGKNISKASEATRDEKMMQKEEKIRLTLRRFRTRWN
jgi:hypothetical protein